MHGFAIILGDAAQRHGPLATTAKPLRGDEVFETQISYRKNT